MAKSRQFTALYKARVAKEDCAVTGPCDRATGSVPVTKATRLLER